MSDQNNGNIRLKDVLDKNMRHICLKGMHIYVKFRMFFKENLHILLSNKERKYLSGIVSTSFLD